MMQDGSFILSLGVNSFMAYAVNLTNFLVTKYTSALTLQVLGNMKGIIATAVSVALFRNPVTPKGLLGYAITVAGVWMYSRSKQRANSIAEAQAVLRDITMVAVEPPPPTIGSMDASSHGCAHRSTRMGVDIAVCSTNNITLHASTRG